MFKIIIYIFLLFTFIGPIIVLFSGQVDMSTNWRYANRSSANIAPDPKQFKEAIVQIYAARTYGWRGLFAVHTWIALKPENADKYTVYQVVGWNIFFGKDVLSITQDVPDRIWFGNKPWIIKEMRGDIAAELIPIINQAVNEYPYKSVYEYWPGPNSNTFIAYIGQKIPQLKLIMPAIAIGKDYLVNNHFVAKTPSFDGYQFSYYGAFGILFGKSEGLEINILGLVYGINPLKLQFTLPGIGSFRLHL
jgi:hypothetical protein